MEVFKDHNSTTVKSVERYSSQLIVLTEGCPIYPTRVDSSLVFAIRQTENQFVNPIPSNRHKSFPLLLIRHTRSRFEPDLENIVDLDLRVG